MNTDIPEDSDGKWADGVEAVIRWRWLRRWQLAAAEGGRWKVGRGEQMVAVVMVCDGV